MKFSERVDPTRTYQAIKFQRKIIHTFRMPTAETIAKTAFACPAYNTTGPLYSPWNEKRLKSG